MVTCSSTPVRPPNGRRRPVLPPVISQHPGFPRFQPKRPGTSEARIPVQADSSEGSEIQVVDFDKQEIGRAVEEKVWLKAAQVFETDFDYVENKMHVFPASLRGLGSRYIVPKVVAIGPYHRGLDHLKEMEKVKHVAAYHFILDCNEEFSYQQMHAAVLPIAGAARRFYSANALQGISNDEFAAMMFIDGCFLLQYMLAFSGRTVLYSSLLSCFDLNEACISNDIMLLENQIPLEVLQILRGYTPHQEHLNIHEFIAKMGRTLQIRGDKNKEPFYLDSKDRPPHLLGLLRHYKVRQPDNFRIGTEKAIRPMSKTISAVELAEIGIEVTASKTTKLTDMGMKNRSFFVVPLLLDEIRSCWLVNMAAYELCITSNSLPNTELPAVCSYLAVLAMLMDRVEDVHELRSRRLVQGELTNRETLDFFKSLIKQISGGPLYTEILEGIEDYKRKWWMLIKVHVFFYKNYKTIAAVFTIIGVLVGIFKALLSVKQHNRGV